MKKEVDEKITDLDKELAQKTVDTGRLPKQARARFIIAILICTGSASLGNVLLKYVFHHMTGLSFHSIRQAPRIVWTVFSNGLFDLATLFLLIEFIAMTYAFRYGPFSLTVPLRGALTYVFTALLAIFFLGEQVSAWRWVAILVIISGITLVGISEE